MSTEAAAPAASFAELLPRLRAAVQSVIIGQDEVVDLALVVILAGGHGLIEGVPGVAKTLLVRALARSVSVEFQRVQFTPDLMPADITGTNVFDLRSHEFRLVPGPVFTGFLLADEVNRAPAKTQSALFQAMQERAVTIDRATHPLPPHFTVFATQNPIEFQGTYPLPEAQKDRFLLKIPMAYPGLDAERELARRAVAGHPPEAALESAAPVLSAAELAAVRDLAAAVVVSDELSRYAVALVRATREHPAILVGAGPRATLAFIHCARALAALRGRDFVLPDDFKQLAEPILAHRLLMRPEFELEGAALAEVIRELLEKTDVPR